MNQGEGRKRRIAYNEPGHAHELTFSCYRRLKLFAEYGVVESFLSELSAARHRLGFELWAYVVMPEHIHVLLYPGEGAATVGQLLQAVKGPFARRIVGQWKQDRHPNLSQIRAGADEYRFWQKGGGYDRNMFTEPAVLSSIDYIHRNPVRRGLVKAGTAYPWSSASAYSDDNRAPIPVDVYQPTRVFWYGGNT